MLECIYAVLIVTSVVHSLRLISALKQLLSMYLTCCEMHEEQSSEEHEKSCVFIKTDICDETEADVTGA